MEVECLTETGLLEIDDVSHSCVFSLLNCG